MVKVVAHVTSLQRDGRNTHVVNSFRKDCECVLREVISLAYLGELQLAEGRYTHVYNSRTQKSQWVVYIQSSMTGHAKKK